MKLKITSADFEKNYPLIISIIVFIIFYFGMDIFPKDITNLTEILSNIINFASIITGFVITALSILVTVAGSRAVKKISKAGKSNVLAKYYAEPLIVGIVLIIMCILELQWTDNNKLFDKIFLASIISAICYFIALFYRVADISMSILNEILKEDDEKKEKKNKNGPDATKSFPITSCTNPTPQDSL